MTGDAFGGTFATAQEVFVSQTRLFVEEDATAVRKFRLMNASARAKFVSSMTKETSSAS